MAAVESSQESAISRKLQVATGGREDELGSALAVQGDILVASSPDATVDGKLYAGAAYVFVRDARGEWLERKRLVPQDGVSFDQFGDEIVVQGDTVVVSASFARVDGVSQRGAVYIFERNHGGQDNWGQLAKLTVNGEIADHFGSSLAIEGDLLAVGASRAFDNGTVTLFERDRGGANAWGIVSTLSDSEVGDAGSPLELFGNSVALAGDLLVVGAPSADVSYFREDDGAVYVFRRGAEDRDQWNLVSRLTAPEAATCTGGRTLAQLTLESIEVQLEAQRCAKEDSLSDHDSFGAAVAIEGDTLIVTAPGTENAVGETVGMLYVYRQDVNGLDRWDLTVRFSGEDVGAGTASGFAGPIAWAADQLLVGAAVAPGTYGAHGAVYTLARDPEDAAAWSVTGRIVAADGLDGERFGARVAFDGQSPVIAATRFGDARGAIYLAADATAQEPAFPPTGELIEGGSVDGPQGSLLGAISGLTEPLPVWIVEVERPDVPFDWGATAIGSYFNVGSSVTTIASHDAPFALALPVAADVDPTRLAAAVLVAADTVSDGPGQGSHWISTVGTYDASRQLFSFALDSLTVTGSTVVLIDDPDLLPLPPPASARSLASPGFEFSCHGFSEAGVCDADAVTSAEFELGEAYARFTELGYENPALRTHNVRLNEAGQFEVAPAVNYFGNQIVPAGIGLCADSAAWYARQHIGLCWPPSKDLRELARHELFHAFQFGFAPVARSARFAGPESRLWVIEGTATAAQGSETSMLRDIFRLPHRVDRSLTSVTDSDEYSAQDFWVHFGQRKGFGLDHLKKLFEHGATTDAVSAFMAAEHQTSLGVAYWDWIQDQAFGKNILFSSSKPPCEVSDDLILGDVTELSLPAGGADAPSEVACAEGKLEGLTAKIVRVKILTDLDATKLSVTAAGSGTLSYKIYLDEVCEPDVVDNQPRTFDSLLKDRQLIVVLANTSDDPVKRVSFTVEGKPADSVQRCP